ncbi:MAG: hypothetical protein M3O46_05660 [Myxococcota bacterium]|nr:hypothetical protein [Myxococcota bacterium]
MAIDRDSLLTAVVVVAAGCSSSARQSTYDDGGVQQCEVDSDAGVSASGPPYCYPESTKPSGACSKDTPCRFCGYPACLVGSGLIEPRTFYECSCVAGNWSCSVLRQSGTECGAVLSCFGPDGGLAVSCRSGAGVSCQMPDGASVPVCVLAGGTTPQPCGNDSCALGCTCSNADPANAACTCR